MGTTLWFEKYSSQFAGEIELKVADLENEQKFKTAEYEEILSEATGHTCFGGRA